MMARSICSLARTVRFFAGAACCAIAFVPGIAAWAATAPMIEVPKWENDQIDTKINAGIVNTATIEFNPEWLKALESREIPMRLPGDEKGILLLRKEFREGRKDVFVWLGTAQGDTQSTVTFTIVNGVLAGTIILSDNRVFKLRSLGGSKYQIDQVDPRKLPPPGTLPERPPTPAGGAAPGPNGVAPAGVPSPAPVVAPAPPAPPPPPPSPPRPPTAPVAAGAALDALPAQPQDTPFPPPPTAFADDKQIDVLFVYTPEALAARSGNRSQLESEVCNVEVETNLTYSENGLPYKVRVVGIEAFDPGRSSSTFNVLQSLELNGGPFISLHARRDALAADIVLVVMVSGDNCGLANRMHRNEPDHAVRAFAVIPINCLTGDYSVAHEIGHLMGAQHEVAADSATDGVLPFNRGFMKLHPREGRAPWYTIMATDKQCVDAARSDCRHLKRWSHPSEQFEQDDLGDATSNEFETLTKMAPLVAKYRCSTSRPAVEGRCFIP